MLARTQLFRSLLNDFQLFFWSKIFENELFLVKKQLVSILNFDTTETTRI